MPPRTFGTDGCAECCVSGVAVQREKLREMLVDTSVACILVGMGSSSRADPLNASKESKAHCLLEKLHAVSGGPYFESLDEIQQRVVDQMNEDDMESIDTDLLSKDKASCSKYELELIRYEPVY
jgi:hypothetical protein